MTGDWIRWGLEVISRKLSELRGNIAKAAAIAGTDPKAIRLVAVTKTQPASAIEVARLAGIDEFGENYVQEFLGKIRAFGAEPGIRKHFIGHLQTNKAASIVGKCDLIQTVDSLKLANKIGHSASAAGFIQDILLQVRLGDEESKSGIEPSRLESHVESICGVEGIRVLGLMGIAPLIDRNNKAADPRPYFDCLRTHYERIPEVNRKILSMGMSGDYGAAIESGSNMIRIGSALFGRRDTFDISFVPKKFSSK